MHTVKYEDYILQKSFAKHAKDLADNYYIEISDEEYDEINSCIEYYNQTLQEIIDHDKFTDVIRMTPEQRNEFITKLEILEQDIAALKEVAYDDTNIKNGVLDITDIK